VRKLYSIEQSGRKDAIFYHKKAVFCSKQAKNGIYTEGSLLELKIKN
jgi:hypothetical protein